MTIFRAVLRMQLTRGRAAALGAVAAVGMLLAFAVSRADELDRAEAAYALVDRFGLGLLVPIASLVFASAALGDPAEDGTLLYLWLRPVRRISIVLSALAASLAVSVPFGAGATTLVAALTGEGGGLVAGALAGSLVAVAAYSTLFLGLGLLVRRALAWGLTYVLIWEGFVARSGTAAARLSILNYARSLLADLAGHEPPTLGASSGVSIVAPLAVAAAAVALTTWALQRADVR